MIHRGSSGRISQRSRRSPSTTTTIASGGAACGSNNISSGSCSIEKTTSSSNIIDNAISSSNSGSTTATTTTTDTTCSSTISTSSSSEYSSSNSSPSPQQSPSSMSRHDSNILPHHHKNKKRSKTSSTTTITSSIHSFFPYFLTLGSGNTDFDSDNVNPAKRMLHMWLFCIMIPSSILIWYYTQGSYFWAILGTITIPVLAILQGSIGILNFRLWFGKAPVPQTPVHGVVAATATSTANNSNTAASSNTQQQQQQQQHLLLSDDEHQQNTFLEEAVQHPPIRLLVIGDSLAIGVGQSSSATPIMPEAMASTLSKKLGRVVYWTCHGAPGASAGWIVRELERGIDFNNNNDEDDGEEEEDGENNDEGIVLLPPSSSPTAATTKQQQQSSSAFKKAQSTFLRCPSETDESSSDESSTGDESPQNYNNNDTNAKRARQQQQQQSQRRRSGVAIHNNNDDTNIIMPTTKHSRKQLELWKDRLEHHRKRFTTDVMGPYDIVVVLTGSNDLKSAFFPFLLTGEDAELRRQARERGGSYTKELRILVETLYRKMQLKWQCIRHAVAEQVEAATESVREKVGETMERFSSSSSSSSNHQQHHHGINHNNSKHSSSLTADASPCRTDSKHNNVPAQSTTPFLSSSPFRRMEQSLSSPQQQYSNPSCVIQQRGNSRKFPLVVLPGMPARALPIFRVVPLRWLAVPIVDIMDMHKRNLAKSHPGEMLFVKAPAVEDLSRYGNREGGIWSDRCNEDTILALRDIRKRDRRRIEDEMHDYYAKTKSFNEQQQEEDDDSSRMRRTSKVSDGSELFSVDRIHPNDKGYDFWGRFIGNAIVDEWLSFRTDPKNQAT